MQKQYQNCKYIKEEGYNYISKMKYNLSNENEQIFMGPIGKDISSDNSIYLQYSNSFNQNGKYDEYQRRSALTEKIEKEKINIRYFADKISYSIEHLINYMKNQTDAIIADNKAMIAENRAMRLDNKANRENNNQMLKTMIDENRRIFQEMRNENNRILFGFARSGGRIDLNTLNNFNI